MLCSNYGGIIIIIQIIVQMLAKIQEKNKVIKLRKQGFSYSEILKRVPVSKSSLSLWLKSIQLAKSQKQTLTEKKLAGMKRGWESRHNKRVQITREIKEKAEKEIDEISKRDLWMIGTALYWAEGVKEKEYSKWSGRIIFSNSDPLMILIFRRYVKEICLVPDDQISYELYIHETADWQKSRKYWADILSNSENSMKVYFKKHKVKTIRKNIGENYHGLVRLQVHKSINLNRRISGWINGICKNCGVV